MDRVRDAEEIRMAGLRFTHPVYGFSPEELASGEDVVLKLGDDYSIFELKSPGHYCGHYLFSSRGREAIAVARLMLSEIFSEYGARVVSGLTPVENKPAIWMTRRLGFDSHGLIETPVGTMELFIKDKK